MYDNYEWCEDFTQPAIAAKLKNLASRVELPARNTTILAVIQNEQRVGLRSSLISRELHVEMYRANTTFFDNDFCLSVRA